MQYLISYKFSILLYLVISIFQSYPSQFTKQAFGQFYVYVQITTGNTTSIVSRHNFIKTWEELNTLNAMTYAVLLTIDDNNITVSTCIYTGQLRDCTVD